MRTIGMVFNVTICTCHLCALWRPSSGTWRQVVRICLHLGMFLITLLEADRRKPEVVGYLSFSGKIVVDSLYCVTERFIVRATSAIWTLFAIPNNSRSMVSNGSLKKIPPVCSVRCKYQ